MLTAGCEKQKALQTSPPSFPDSFSVNMKAAFGEIEVTAELTQNAPENFVLKILSPEALSPLSLSYEDGTCSVKYNDLSFETDLDRFPQSEMGAIITHALSDAVQGIDIEVSCTDGIWTYRGNVERGSFTLTRDALTGAPIELTVGGADLHASFSDYAEK